MINWSLIPPWFWVVSAALFGAVVGSFVNAAIHRLPRNISMLTRSRSFCPHCEATIHWYDNLPILSFLALGGRCRACHIRIPSRYLVVEVLCASLYGLASYQYFVLNAPVWPSTVPQMPWIILLIQLLLIADLVCLAFTDLETWYIPIQTTWPWIVLGLILAPCFPELHLSRTEWLAEPATRIISSAARWNALIDSLQGLIWGAGVPWLVGFACLVYLKKEGMGSGDAHLLGMLGAMLGWKAAMTVFLIGTFIGLFLGLGSMAWGRIQRARLGDRWKPRQPTFELNEEELEPPPAWPLLVCGVFVLIVESAVITVHLRAYRFAMPPIDELPFSAILGALLGLCLLLGYLFQNTWSKTNSWPQGQRSQREDGTTEETLQGNYIPFGPSLALAGLIVLFYDPLFQALPGWWMWQIPIELPFHLLGLG